MGRYELEYPKDATNLVKRHGERGQKAHPSPLPFILTFKL